MKYLYTLIAFLLVISISPTKIYSQERQAGSSAKFTAYEKRETSPDIRVMALKNVFKKYNSPLVNYAPMYVKYADLYNVDWKLLPAISGLESSFGVYLMPDSYNAYGWGGGYIYFNDWEDGIETINRSLRFNYIDKGANNVWKIGPIYAESKTWSQRVSSFMEEINREYIKLNSSYLTINL